MTRVPVLPTIVVAIAVAAMVALGLWQLLDRAPRKAAYLAQVAANPLRPPVAFPAVADEALLFRRSRATCLHPVRQTLVGAGSAGYRLIVECATAPQAEVVTVQLGTTRDPAFRSRWPGGVVAGFISHAPDGRSLIATLFDHRVARPMLVADTPPPGLTANPRPNPAAVANNHLSYAVQWFLFAVIAAVIYGIAVRRRWSQ